MFWQQKMTPSHGGSGAAEDDDVHADHDSAFIFLTTAAALAIYCFVSNLWAIGQQYFTNWLIGPPAVQRCRPAAERRIKNAGAGTQRPGARSDSVRHAP